MSIKRKLSLVTILVITVTCVGYGLLRGSLPQLSGLLNSARIQNDVIIERDKLGVPTIAASSREDIAVAMGFLHAQERFFQMDLFRRYATGELSELLGSATVGLDKSLRTHQFKEVAKKILAQLPASERKLLDAYNQGVREGFDALNVSPVEYFLLKTTPKPWRDEDPLLVTLCFHLQLQQTSIETSLAKKAMEVALPPTVYDFLLNNTSQWEATLDNQIKPVMAIPSSKDFEYIHLLENLKKIRINSNANAANGEMVQKGSNQWAIHKEHTATKESILACDMHLPLSIPNTFYRLSIHYPDHVGQKVSVHGVTLPGTPFITIGSNHHIAWGFTNSYLNTAQPILLEESSDGRSYLTATGYQPYISRIEGIKVNGKRIKQKCDVLTTCWGPVLDKQIAGKRVALNWVAHDVNSCNTALIDLEQTCDIKFAMEQATKIKMPALNFMSADKQGNIGWSLTGHLPQIAAKYMSNNGGIINPSTGFLWSANNRVLHQLSDAGSYPNPIRAYQIKKRLLETSQHSLESSCNMQLDDEAISLVRWKDLLIGALDSSKESHQKIRQFVAEWDGRCGADSKGVFWIYNFKKYAMKQILERLLAPMMNCYEGFSWQGTNLDFEESVYQILKQHPSYLIHPYMTSWQEELTLVIDTMINHNRTHLLANKSWGSSRTATIQHLLSKELPSWLSNLVDMPKTPIGGSGCVPFVLTPKFGATVRMVVQPGSKTLGVISLPCGQSGHPLSPHFKDHHQYWIEGKYLPLLPGQTVTKLVLRPKKK